ncbi:MAG: hypothetical protein QM504_10215 [Pseudomonadota bacterium]
MNNFNTNSQGLSLDFNGSYDGFLSQHEFDESFNESGDQWVYTDYGNFSKLEKEFKLVPDVSLKDFLLIAACIQYPTLSKYDAYKEFRKESFDNYSWSEMSFDDIMELLSDSVFYVETDCVMAELKALDKDILVPNYEIVEVRGYSQGDYAEVILFEKIKSEFQDDFNFTNMFSGMFYDSPISGVLTIDDTEIYLDEYVDNRYLWDKDSFIEGLRKGSIELTTSFWGMVKNFFDFNTPLFRRLLTADEINEIERFIPDTLEHVY